MWVVGTIYLWVAATVVWFRWAMREEAAGEGADGREGGGAERAVPPEAYATRLRPSPPTGAA
jgi:hypothetical protein